MLRSVSAPHLAKSSIYKTNKRSPFINFLGSKWVTFWGVVIIWTLYLSISAYRSPPDSISRRSRFLLEASSVKGRLEAINFGQEPLLSLRSIVRTVISPGFKEFTAEATASEGHGAGEYDPLFKHVESVAAQLSQLEKQVACPWDPSLEADLPQLKGRKYLIAANFHNNEELLPHVIVQIWHLLAILPEGSAFLSVYESDSSDSTGAWLEVLRQLMAAMQVPHRILAGANLTRQPDQDRIDFLAQVRNAALEPLWQEAGSPAGAGTLGGKDRQPLWPADEVVFLNDVYFCARDAVRLLLHDADMACGMDFDRKKLDQIPEQDQRQYLGSFLHNRWKLPAVTGKLLGHFPPLLLLHSRSATANKVFRKELPLGFYDRWVARDANGELFKKEEPYGSDPYTMQRLPKGLPFPVKCCWNGLVSMNAAPFTRQNLRIRAHKKDECAASECSLLCNDFLRVGYSNMVVDPGVRQAYSVKDAKDLYDTEWVKGVELSSWGDVTLAPPIDWNLVPFRPFSQCCGLKEGNNMVDFDKDCHWENMMYPNFTATTESTAEMLRHRRNATASFRIYG